MYRSHKRNYRNNRRSLRGGIRRSSVGNKLDVTFSVKLGAFFREVHDTIIII